MRKSPPKTISFFFAILRKIIMEIPALIILNLLFPLYGLAYAQAVTEVILAAAAVLVLRSMFRKMAQGGNMQKENREEKGGNI